MAKFKGTSGQWKFSPFEKDSNGCISVEIPFGTITVYNGYHPLDFKKEKDKVIELAEANAKLIAAAPEILEALQHTLEVLYQCDPPKELFETYANVFANYNDLIHRATE